MRTVLTVFLVCTGVVSALRLDQCELPAVEGPCRAALPRFFYNAATADCEEFNYGGCGGNANRFQTYYECAATCAEHLPTPQYEARLEEDTDSVYSTLKKPYKGVDFEVGCRPAPESGICLAYFERWFYNVKTGRCETFVYGGCGGNKNNYETPAECEVACLRF
ncbi:boophilin-G2-like [Ornithodoros turicata]|uniref:boophilin-G2-like n=1 Tax=Ornithodoros turicata TaxID=34597 RepID=UPI003139598D